MPAVQFPEGLFRRALEFITPLIIVSKGAPKLVDGAVVSYASTEKCDAAEAELLRRSAAATVARAVRGALVTPALPRC
jgi:hypothetical protein